MVPESQKPAAAAASPVEGEDDDGERDPVQEDRNGPAHHPTAPSDELFDISTTVDPGYIISLIRKLLPSEVQGADPCTHSIQRSKSDCKEEDAASPSRNGAGDLADGDADTMDIGNIEFNSSRSAELESDSGYLRVEQPKMSAREAAWEESGCILWDLAANKSHAEFMVENLVLEVLLVNLTASDSVRIKEISLGIIGNIACHEVLMKQIISTSGLMETVIDQVFLDDTPCLCETCRSLTMGLRGPEFVTWTRALHSENVLSRVLWIAENTLNAQLVEKSVGLLLAIIENQHEVAPILLPMLRNMGLLRILVNLFSFEAEKLTSERMPERYPALDSILHALEALSTIDDYSPDICSNKELFQMATEMVKLPDKIEIASSCVNAAVLIANILTDVADLALEMSKDDFGARNALWSIVARLLFCVQETEMSRSSLAEYVLALVSKSDLIEDDLLDDQLDASIQKHENAAPAAELNFRNISLKRIISILNQWNELKDCTNGENSSAKIFLDDGEIQKLLGCCLKHAC